MKYIYDGPISGVTLKDSEKAKEVMLFPGKEVDLPESNEYVKKLVAQGYLRLVETKKTAKAPIVPSSERKASKSSRKKGGK